MWGFSVPLNDLTRGDADEQLIYYWSSFPHCLHFISGFRIWEPRCRHSFLITYKIQFFISFITRSENCSIFQKLWKLRYKTHTFLYFVFEILTISSHKSLQCTHSKSIVAHWECFVMQNVEYNCRNNMHIAVGLCAAP